MNYHLLYNKIQRIPFKQATQLVDRYKKEVGFKNFSEQQEIINILDTKHSLGMRIKQDAYPEFYVMLMLLISQPTLSEEKFLENVEGYPFGVWIEIIGQLEDRRKFQFLDKYYKYLNSTVIETFIINMQDDAQVRAINKYLDKIDPKSKLYDNFYYSVSNSARNRLSESFPNVTSDNILLEMNNISERELVVRLEDDFERLNNQDINELLEFVLLRAKHKETLFKFLSLYHERISELSIPKFNLLFNRYQQLPYPNRYLDEYNNLVKKYDKREKYDVDTTLFLLYKEKFRQMNVWDTLRAFNYVDTSILSSDSDISSVTAGDKFTATVILEFIDDIYLYDYLGNYFNEDVLSYVISRLVSKYSSNIYTIDDFKNLVDTLEVKDANEQLLIPRDYIEAVMACRYLFNNNIIDDKNPMFLELRKKFIDSLEKRITKDGTYSERFNFNGLFYRLVKGTLPFDDVYNTKTYRGLIYLARGGNPDLNMDGVTKYLSDYQLANLNMKSFFKWRNSELEDEDDVINLNPFRERMALQLYLYFGLDKAKHILDSELNSSKMEYLFDNLNYKSIEIIDDGHPKNNSELISFLFGNGSIKEPNSIINKLLKDQLPGFDNCFKEFCNSFEKIKSGCNGYLSVKRIIRYLSDLGLPVVLKPDELLMTPYLLEMHTSDVDYINEAISLCKDARNREFSTIPKIKGEIGEFTYEMLDLDNPLSLAVGYLSHDCFVVHGESYEALKHSMQSHNGRTFVVYRNGNFFAQSWVWRNGNVVCFDSVEAGSKRFNAYKDDVNLVSVYKKAAEDILEISGTEDKRQQIKFVTVGKSDYTFDELEELNFAPKPIENNVYVYDSRKQKLLAGVVPRNIYYGEIDARYLDPVKKTVVIDSNQHMDLDYFDDQILNINSLRYQIYGVEDGFDYQDYQKIISGDGWYILLGNDGEVETGIIKKDKRIVDEYNFYLSRYGSDSNCNNNSDIPKQFQKVLSGVGDNNGIS